MQFKLEWNRLIFRAEMKITRRYLSITFRELWNHILLYIQHIWKSHHKWWLLFDPWTLLNGIFSRIGIRVRYYQMQQRNETAINPKFVRKSKGTAPMLISYQIWSWKSKISPQSDSQLPIRLFECDMIDANYAGM